MDGLQSTSLMTLFSYSVSKEQQKNFKEPALLGRALEKEGVHAALAQPAGWAVHYCLGVAWGACLRLLIKRAGMKPRMLEGLLLGAGGGLFAVGCWRPVIRRFGLLSPRDARRFYGHLVLAHIAFTMALMKRING